MSQETPSLFMTPAQLHTELMRCEFCEEKPCREACPAHCSPADFIMAARIGQASDMRRSAAEIMQANPLGGICGLVCPDTLCMAACTRKKFDGSINIPLIQATIIETAKNEGGIPEFKRIQTNGKKVAVVGGGPAGLGAASALAQLGYSVHVYEKINKLGGMLNLIPTHRITQKAINSDINFLLSLGDIKVFSEKKIDNPRELLNQGYDAVCIAAGLWKPIEIGIQNENLAIKMVDFLSTPNSYQLSGKVAIIGGGATAVDCAVTAKIQGADSVELFMLEKYFEMPITSRERKDLLDFDIELNGRTRIKRILETDDKITGLETIKVQLPKGKAFHPSVMVDINTSASIIMGFSTVILAIGMRSDFQKIDDKGIFYAGDIANGPRTVVEATASGKNTALAIDAYIQNKTKPNIKNQTKSYFTLPGYCPTPISLNADFFGRPIKSPYLLSASPSTDGLEQMNHAYDAGWAGGILKQHLIMFLFTYPVNICSLSPITLMLTQTMFLDTHWIGCVLK